MKYKLLEQLKPLGTVLQHLHVKNTLCKEMVVAYHSIAHQASLVIADSQVDQKWARTWDSYCYQWCGSILMFKSSLSSIQWLQKRQKVLDVDEWGGDVELLLLAIGLHFCTNLFTWPSTSTKNVSFCSIDYEWTVQPVEFI